LVKTETAVKLDSLLFMVPFALVLYVVIAPVILVIMIVQALFTLSTGETNANLRVFSATLSKYIYQVLQFLIYNAEEKPFPFSDLPEVDGGDFTPAGKSADRKTKNAAKNTAKNTVKSTVRSKVKNTARSKVKSKSKPRAKSEVGKGTEGARGAKDAQGEESAGSAGTNVKAARKAVKQKATPKKTAAGKAKPGANGSGNGTSG